jgi:hypothetical protein
MLPRSKLMNMPQKSAIPTLGIRYNMHFHPHNKYSMFYKYDLYSIFLERDIKAMQKRKRMGHMKVPKNRKKGTQ